jgi:hypothetical protein
MEDIDGGSSQAEQFAMAKALASGDDRLKNKAGLEMEIGRLERKRQSFISQQAMVRREIKDAKERIERANRRLADIEADLAKRITPERNDDFRFEMEADVGADGAVTWVERHAAGKGLERFISNSLFVRAKMTKTIATYRGFEIFAEGWEWKADNGLAYTLKIYIDRAGVHQAVYEQDVRQGLAIVNRIDHALDNIEREKAAAEDDIELSQKAIADYTPRLSTGGWDMQPVLDEKRAQLRDIDESLAASEREANKSHVMAA